MGNHSRCKGRRGEQELARLLAGELGGGEARLVDGRNRRAACQLAGVAPEVRWLKPDDDVAAYIHSTNVTRRHLTTGQKAIITAKLLLSNNHTQQEAGKLTGLSQTRIAQANIVLQHAPDLVEGVTSGATPLNDAYKIAQGSGQWRRRSCTQKITRANELP